MEPTRDERRRTKQFKITALALLFCFVFNATVWPIPEVRVSAPRFGPDVFLPSLGGGIQIPESLGTVTDTYAGDSPLVIYIPDAHAEPQAQARIREILEHLRRHYGLKRIFVEGGIGRLDPRLLEFFKDPRLNQKMGELLAEEGVLGGPELFLLERLLEGDPDSVKAFGVEGPSLYRENLLAYQSVLGGSDLAQTFLDRFRSELLSVSSRVLKPRLRSFFKEWSFEEETEGDWVRRLSRLEESAREVLRLDLSDPREQRHWPQLVRIVKFKEFERTIDSGKAERDRKRLVQWLGRESLLEYQKGIECLGNPLLMRKKDSACPSSPRGFLEKFYEQTFPAGFRFKDYEAWARQAGAVVLESEIRPARLLSEAEELRNRILERLAVSKEERALVELYQDHLLLKKLFSLELLGKEFDRVQERRRLLAPGVLVERLRAITPAGFHPSTGLSGETPRAKLEILFRRAVGFYRKAREREETIYRQVSSLLQEEGEGSSVLVAGGFHAEGLKRKFREGGIRYLEITPAVSRVEANGRYRDLMTFKEDLHTFRSHLRFFSRIQSLGEVTLARVGKEAAHHGAMGINSAVGRVFAQRRGDFNRLREEVNSAPAFRRHGLRYVDEGPGEILHLNGEAVEIHGKRVGVSPQGPRFFSAARSELRVPWEDLFKDYEEFDRFEELLRRSQQLAGSGRYQQFSMVLFKDLEAEQIPLQRIDRAPSLGVSPEEFLKQSLTDRFGTLVLGLRSGARQTTAQRKKAEGYRYVLIKASLSDSSSKAARPTLLVVVLGPDAKKDFAEFRQRRKRPDRSELRSPKTGGTLYREMWALTKNFDYVRAIGTLNDLKLLFEERVKAEIPQGDDGGRLRQVAARRNQKLLGPLFSAIEKEGEVFYRLVLNFALGLSSEEANGRLGERALEGFDSQKRQAIRQQADFLRKALRPVGSFQEGELPTESELEVVQFLERFGVEINLEEGSYGVPDTLRADAAKFRDDLEHLRKAVVLERSGPITVVTIYNGEDERLRNGNHPFWGQAEKFLKTYYAVLHFKRLRAEQDESFDQTLPSREEVAAILGEGLEEIKKIEQEMGIDPETGKSTLLSFHRKWRVRFLPDGSPVTLTEAEQKIISERVIPDMLDFNLQVQIIKSIVEDEAEEGEDFSTVLNFFREIRREVGDVWRLHYLFLEKELWAPYTRFLTALSVEGGGPEHSREDRRLILVIHKSLKSAEAVWRAYQRLSQGEGLSQEMVQAILTDDQSRFPKLLLEINGFYEGHEYFQSVPFKSAVGSGIVLSPGERKELQEEEAIKAAEPFVNSLRTLGDASKTRQAAGAFMKALVEYAAAHYGEPEAMESVRQFFERTETFLVGFDTEPASRAREYFDEVKKAVESFELEGAGIPQAGWESKIYQALGPPLKAADPAYHFVKELLFQGVVLEETAKILAVIASRRDLAAAGAAENLEKEIAKVLKRPEEEIRDLLNGKTRGEPALILALGILTGRLKGRDWTKEVDLETSRTGSLLQDALKAGEITNEERLEIEALMRDPESFYWQRYRKAKDPDALLLHLSRMGDRLERRYGSLASKIEALLIKNESAASRPFVEAWPATVLSGLDLLAGWLTRSTKRQTDPRDLAAFLYQRGYRFDAAQGLEQVVVRRPTEAVLDTFHREEALKKTIDDEIRLFFTRQVTSSMEWETFLKLLGGQIRDQVQVEEAAALLRRPLDRYLKEKLGELGVDPFGLALRRAYLVLDELRDEISIRTLQEGLAKILPEEGPVESARMSERLARLNEVFPGLKMSIDKKAFPFAVREEAEETLNALPPAGRENERRLIRAYFGLMDKTGLPPAKDELKEELKEKWATTGELLAHFETTLAEANTILTGAGYKPLRFPAQPFTLVMAEVTLAYYRHVVLEKNAKELFTWDTLLGRLKIERGSGEEKKLARGLGSFEEHQEEADLIDKIHPGFYDTVELLWLEAEERLKEISGEEERETRDYFEEEINQAVSEKLLPSLTKGGAVTDHEKPEDYLASLEKEMGAKKLLGLALKKSGLSEKDLRIIWAWWQSAEDSTFGDLGKMTGFLKKNGVEVRDLEAFEALEKANDLLGKPFFVTHRTFFILGERDDYDERAARLFREKIRYAPAKNYEGFLGTIVGEFGETSIGDSEAEAALALRLRLKWKLNLGRLEWAILRAWWEISQKTGKKSGEVDLGELLEAVSALASSPSQPVTKEDLGAGTVRLNAAFRNLKPSFQLTLRSEVRRAQKVIVVNFQMFQEWPGLIGEAVSKITARVTGRKTSDEQATHFTLVSMEGYEKKSLDLKKLAEAKSLGVEPPEFLRQALEASFDEQILGLKSGQRRSRAVLKRTSEFEFALLEAVVSQKEGDVRALLVVFLKKKDHEQFVGRVDQDWGPKPRLRSELRNQAVPGGVQAVDAREAKAVELIRAGIRFEEEGIYPEAEKALEEGIKLWEVLSKEAKAKTEELPAGNSPEGLRIRAFEAGIRKFSQRKEGIKNKLAQQEIERKKRRPAVATKALLLALVQPGAGLENAEWFSRARDLLGPGREEWREVLGMLPLVKGMLDGGFVPVTEEQTEVAKVLEGLGVRREGKGPFQSTSQKVNQAAKNLGERLEKTEAPLKEETALIEKLTTLSDEINLEKAFELLAQLLAKWHLRSGQKSPSRFVTTSEEEMIVYYRGAIQTYRALYGAELEEKRLPTLTGEAFGRMQNLPAPGKGGERRLGNLREGLNTLGFGELELVKDLLAARVNKGYFYPTFEALRQAYFEDRRFTNEYLGEKIGLNASSTWTRRRLFNEALEETTGIPAGDEAGASLPKGLVFDLEPLIDQKQPNQKLRQLKFAEMRSEVRTEPQTGASGDNGIEALHKQAVEFRSQGKLRESLAVLDRAMRVLEGQLKASPQSIITRTAIQMKLARLRKWRLEVDSEREKAEAEERDKAEQIKREQEEKEKRERALLGKGLVLALALGRERLTGERHKGVMERALAIAAEELEKEIGISTGEGQKALLETTLEISQVLGPDWIPEGRTLGLIDRLRPHGLEFDEQEARFSATPGLQGRVEELTKELGLGRKLEPLERALQIALVLGKRNFLEMGGLELQDSALERFEVPETAARETLKLATQIASFIEHEGVHYFTSDDIRLEESLGRFGLRWDDAKLVYAISKSLEAEVLAAREDLGMEEKPLPGIVVVEALVTGSKPAVLEKKPEPAAPRETDKRVEATDAEVKEMTQRFALEPDFAKRVLELDRQLREIDPYYGIRMKNPGLIARSVQRAVAMAFGAFRAEEEWDHWRDLERFWKSPKATTELKKEALGAVRVVMFVKNGAYRQEHDGVEELSITDLLRLRQLLRTKLGLPDSGWIHKELREALRILRDEKASPLTSPLEAEIRELLKVSSTEPSGRVPMLKEVWFHRSHAALSTFYLLRVLKVILETELIGDRNRGPYRNRFDRAWQWISKEKEVSLAKISEMEKDFRLDRSELRISSVVGVAEETEWIFGEEAVRELGVAVTSRIPTWQSRLSADHFNGEDQARAFSLFDRLRNHSTVLAPVVHLRHGLLLAERHRPAALPQIFDAVKKLIEINRHHAHRFVLVLDEREDADFVQTELRNFLQAQYPASPGKRNQIFSRVHLVTGENSLIGNLIPRGAATVWVDWLGAGGRKGRVPAIVEKLQVHGDQILGGGHIRFDGGNKGYGASLLQALELLLNGPDQSGLQASPEGPYVQISLSSFADFGRLFMAVQKIAASA